MPRKRASAAKHVLLYEDSYLDVFEKIHNLHIILRLRLVCKILAQRMLFLRRSVYIIHRSGQIFSAYHRILYLRSKKCIRGWYGAPVYVPLICIHRRN